MAHSDQDSIDFCFFLAIVQELFCYMCFLYDIPPHCSIKLVCMKLLDSVGCNFVVWQCLIGCVLKKLLILFSNVEFWCVVEFSM